jgi:hypothetical protein
VEHRPARRDRTPDKTQRLLNHAVWDTVAAMPDGQILTKTRLIRAAGLRWLVE